MTSQPALAGPSDFMKRSLVYLLIVIVVAGVLGTLIAKDPGYVLISYGGMSLQTGLWVMLTMLAVLIAVIYYLLRLFKVVGRSAAAWRNWRESRAMNRSARLTARGLMYFQEGDFERAERFLKNGAATTIGSAVNFIYAAKAADAQGKGEQRETYLRQARAAENDAGRAIAIASAEMAITRGEFQKALSALDSVKSSPGVTRLKRRALLALEDWQSLSDLMPELRKSGMDKADIDELQKKVALARLTAPDTSDAALGAVYKKLPDSVKFDQAVLLAYCRRLESETAAEAAVRAALKHAWYPELVALYGGLGRETLTRRIKAAEGWQQQHADDAALQLCLGELYEANGDKQKAVSAYQRSVELGNSPVAGKHLGRMLAFEGDYKKSNEYLIQALNAK